MTPSSVALSLNICVGGGGGGGHQLTPTPVLASHTCLPGSDKKLLDTTRSQTDIELFMVSAGRWWVVRGEGGGGGGETTSRCSPGRGGAQCSPDWF